MRNRYAIALAVLSAAATGSAIQILYAQGTPPAYVVAEINVSNQDAYAKEFVPPEVKSITDGGGKFLARGGKTISFEGAAPAPRVVIIEFASLDKANTWRNASAHTSAMEIGKKHATFRSFAVEGLGTR
jgi:uncharacterized protein (DUF1330 family)